MLTVANAEYTDTFGGEANYSWVKRYRFPTDGKRRSIVRKAKAAFGLTGERGVTTDHGDMIEFRPYGSATVLFITFGE